jgi:hypothetical protein
MQERVFVNDGMASNRMGISYRRLQQRTGCDFTEIPSYYYFAAVCCVLLALLNGNPVSNEVRTVNCVRQPVVVQVGYGAPSTYRYF